MKLRFDLRGLTKLKNVIISGWRYVAETEACVFRKWGKRGEG